MKRPLFPLASALFALHPLPAAALDLAEAAARLAAIEVAMSDCLGAQGGGGTVLPGTLRDCIAAVRPGDHTLRRDLNGWIPLLAEGDPDRAEALRTRLALNALRTFMNHLDVALLHRRAAVERSTFDATVRAACLRAGIGAADGPSAPPAMPRIALHCD